MRLLLKGLVGMALAWLVIGFGIIFSCRSGLSSGIKSNRWPGDVIPDDNDCGWYVRFFCHERKHHDVPVYAATFVVAL